MRRLFLLAPLVACTGDTPKTPVDSGAPGAGGASVSDVTQVIPGDAIPVQVQPSNNNLDILEHDGGFFLSWRTAPTHFASADTELHVVRSDDGEQSWTLEHTITMGRDLREPRFLSWDGKLFLFFAAMGTSSTSFEPGETYVTVRDAGGSWSEPQLVYDGGFIPWRMYIVDGAPVMIGYTGGDSIYDFGGDTGSEGTYNPQLEVKLLTSTDGLTWTALVPGKETVHTGGGSETAIAWMDDGGLVAVMRNEAGDEDGWGSKVCTAEAGALADWTCEPDPKKYDSPLVWEHEGRVWLIGRRNVTDDGHYDLGYDHLEMGPATLQYQAEYWGHPKRCSLWEVDRATRTVEFVLDLPSRGDTCFASALPAGGDDFIVYNYSSPIDGPDVTWLEGQLGDTNIYRQIVTVPGAD